MYIYAYICTVEYPDFHLIASLSNLMRTSQLNVIYILALKQWYTHTHTHTYRRTDICSFTGASRCHSLYKLPYCIYVCVCVCKHVGRRKLISRYSNICIRFHGEDYFNVNSLWLHVYYSRIHMYVLAYVFVHVLTSPESGSLCLQRLNLTVS